MRKLTANAVDRLWNFVCRMCVEFNAAPNVKWLQLVMRRSNRSAASRINLFPYDERQRIAGRRLILESWSRRRKSLSSDHTHTLPDLPLDQILALSICLFLYVLSPLTLVCVCAPATYAWISYPGFCYCVYVCVRNWCASRNHLWKLVGVWCGQRQFPGDCWGSSGRFRKFSCCRFISTHNYTHKDTDPYQQVVDWEVFFIEN